MPGTNNYQVRDGKLFFPIQLDGMPGSSFVEAPVISEIEVGGVHKRTKGKIVSRTYVVALDLKAIRGMPTDPGENYVFDAVVQIREPNEDMVRLGKNNKPLSEEATTRVREYVGEEINRLTNLESAVAKYQTDRMKKLEMLKSVPKNQRKSFLYRGGIPPSDKIPRNTPLISTIYDSTTETAVNVYMTMRDRITVGETEMQGSIDDIANGSFTNELDTIRNSMRRTTLYDLLSQRAQRNETMTFFDIMALMYMTLKNVEQWEDAGIVHRDQNFKNWFWSYAMNYDFEDAQAFNPNRLWASVAAHDFETVTVIDEKKARAALGDELTKRILRNQEVKTKYHTPGLMPGDGFDEPSVGSEIFGVMLQFYTALTGEQPYHFTVEEGVNIARKSKEFFQDNPVPDTQYEFTSLVEAITASGQGIEPKCVVTELRKIFEPGISANPMRRFESVKEPIKLIENFLMAFSEKWEPSYIQQAREYVGKIINQGRANQDENRVETAQHLDAHVNLAQLYANNFAILLVQSGFMEATDVGTADDLAKFIEVRVADRERYGIMHPVLEARDHPFLRKINVPILYNTKRFTIKQRKGKSLVQAPFKEQLETQAMPLDGNMPDPRDTRTEDPLKTEMSEEDNRTMFVAEDDKSNTVKIEPEDLNKTIQIVDTQEVKPTPQIQKDPNGLVDPQSWGKEIETDITDKPAKVDAEAIRKEIGAEFRDMTDDGIEDLQKSMARSQRGRKVDSLEFEKKRGLTPEHAEFFRTIGGRLAEEAQQNGDGDAEIFEVRDGKRVPIGKIKKRKQ